MIQDETLFGPPARLKQMTGNRSWGGSSAPDLSPLGGGGGSSQVGKKAGGRGRRRMSNDPEVVQVITKDLIRKIRFELQYVTTGFGCSFYVYCRCYKTFV